MQASEIRRRFIDFFSARGHRHVPSSSLVPQGDATLLFTNAGMVQFKRVFQGVEKREYNRAVTVQKCVRAGGKHNDLEQVGHTTRHLTFFEMLGNFSFGDYFKRDAIDFAWEFVTGKDWLALDPERLRVTVHQTDDEARRLWREITGIADERIFALGEDNFWQMADTGPCGPCTEIFVDLRDQASGRSGEHTLEEFVAACEREEFVEIWNLVFMQYDRQPGGELVPLPAPSVDTGAGLDRMSSVLQGETSIFHSDLLLPLIERAAQIIGKPYDRGARGASMRVLADHARAVAFLLADGVYPSNEGRGYVLRRILRRAVRHAWLEGRREPTLALLVGQVVDSLGGVYPELESNRRHIEDVTRAEEERFLETIEGGLGRLASLNEVSGDEAFKLYDTYGFPIDLTQIIAGERGVAVDVAGFEKLLEEQRDRSRSARKTALKADGAVKTAQRSGAWTRVKPRLKQKFVGYESLEAETDILAFQHAGDRLGLLLQLNPFYAESGGQVSDTGSVVARAWKLDVDEVRKTEKGSAVFGRLPEAFDPVELVRGLVNEQRRRDTERNHSVTHLVHWALRKVLGTHVRQAGSIVQPERMRFDFTHHAPLGPDNLARVEQEVNEWIWKNVDVSTDQMAYDKALESGAMALFGEKYGDRVRVVTMGPSVELCGGTHVRTTGQIGFLKLVGESGVGSGVRRIEAVTGPGAFAWFASQQKLLELAAGAVGSTPEHLAKRVESLAEEKRKLEKRVEDLIKKGGAGGDTQTTEANGAAISVAKTPANDRNEIGTMVDAFRNRTRSGVLVVFADGERPGIHVGVTDDLVSRGIVAGDIVNRLAALAGGKGGGRPHFASAGASSGDGLREAERRATEIVKGALEGKA